MGGEGHGAGLEENRALALESGRYLTAGPAAPMGFISNAEKSHSKRTGLHVGGPKGGDGANHAPGVIWTFCALRERGELNAWGTRRGKQFRPLPSCSVPTFDQSGWLVTMFSFLSPQGRLQAAGPVRYFAQGVTGVQYMYVPVCGWHVIGRYIHMDTGWKQLVWALRFRGPWHSYSVPNGPVIVLREETQVSMSPPRQIQLGDNPMYSSSGSYCVPDIHGCGARDHVQRMAGDTSTLKGHLRVRQGEETAGRKEATGQVVKASGKPGRGRKRG